MEVPEEMRYEDEGLGMKLLKKAQSNPFLAVGE